MRTFASLLDLFRQRPGLRPLQRLRADVTQRHHDDLTPIDPEQVPKDVRPLVDAIKDVGFKYAMLSGVTIAIDDINVPAAKEEKPAKGGKKGGKAKKSDDDDW